MAFVVCNNGEGDALKAIVAHTAATALIPEPRRGGLSREHFAALGYV